jgi:hypothetical protein
MKTFALVLALLCSTTFAEDPVPGAAGTPSPPPGATGTKTDAPVVAPEFKLKLLPDGTPEKGRSVHLEMGEFTPFAGQLIDDQEHTRREKINARNAASLAEYKDPGSIALSKAQLIAIVAGAVVVGAAAATGVVLALEKKPRSP